MLINSIAIAGENTLTLILVLVGIIFAISVGVGLFRVTSGLLNDVFLPIIEDKNLSFLKKSWRLIVAIIICMLGVGWITLIVLALNDSSR